MSTDAIDLAEFDDAATFELDPLIYTQNLAALREVQPKLAQRLEHTELPAAWRPVSGLDGFPTWRLEPAGDPAQWLAGTAAPRTRGEMLFRVDQLADKNPALSTIAAGAELELLLQRLLPRQAVYVFEDELETLAAVMRTVALAREILAWRCIVLPPEHPAESLERMLSLHPGLLPPGSILRIPPTTDERLARVSAICDGIAHRVGNARSQRLAELTAGVTAPATEPPVGPRVAIIALGPKPQSHQLAAALACAGEELDWHTCCCAACTPRDVHALPHCERLGEFAPELSICIDHPPTALPLGGRIACQWHLRVADVPETLPDDRTIHLAATPRIAQTLRATGIHESRLADFFWGFPSSAPPVASHESTPRTLIVIGNLADTSAAACGIEQPTHKQLWAQLQMVAARAWETADIIQPTALLRSAERISGVELGDAALRKQMVRIIEHVLIPTVVLERIIQELGEESVNVVAVGAGWNRCSSKTIRAVARNLDGSSEEVAELNALAAVFAGCVDPLDPALFQAAALDWPLLIHSPGHAALTPRLGGILHPREHYDPFAGARDLRAALEGLRRDPVRARRRSARVRAHLSAQHGYAQRLLSLGRQLGLDWPAVTR